MKLLLIQMLWAVALARPLEEETQRVALSHGIDAKGTVREPPLPTSTSQTRDISPRDPRQIGQWSEAISCTTTLSSHTLRYQDTAGWGHFPSWASVTQKHTSSTWGYGAGATPPTKVLAVRASVSTSIDNLSSISSSAISSVSSKVSTKEDLDNYDRNLNWHLDVTVSGNTYDLLFDTGSSDLWIQSSTFVPSSTFDPLPNLNFNISYTGGSTVNGPVGNDTVAFAGLSVTQQLIAVPTSVNLVNGGIGAPGIIGMSYPNLTSVYTGTDVAADSASNRFEYSSILNTIFNIEQLTKPIFSVALSRSATTESDFGGILTMGGLPSFNEPSINVTGSLSTVANASPRTRYDVSIDGISFAELIAQDNGGVYTLDTGTTYILTTDAIANDVATKYEPAGVWDASEGVYMTSCSAVPPSFHVTIGGHEFPINPVDLLYGDVGNADASCTIPISGGNSKVLGGVFLRNVLAVFDWGTEQISLGSREYYDTS